MPRPRRRETSTVRISVICTCGRTNEVVLAPIHKEVGEVSVSAQRLRLTPDQARVLALAADGYTDREIARNLRVPLNRVKHDIRDALMALSSRNRTQAVVMALRAGILAE